MLTIIIHRERELLQTDNDMKRTKKLFYTYKIKKKKKEILRRSSGKKHVAISSYPKRSVNVRLGMRLCHLTVKQIMSKRLLRDVTKGMKLTGLLTGFTMQLPTKFTAPKNKRGVIHPAVSNIERHEQDQGSCFCKPTCCILHGEQRLHWIDSSLPTSPSVTPVDGAQHLSWSSNIAILASRHYALGAFPKRAK